MISTDVEYVKKVVSAGLIKSPCLELGVACEGANNRELILNSGVTYFGTDMVTGNGVDFVVDFEDSTEVVEKCFEGIGKFGSVLVLNVLEHTFDPIRILDNIFSILRTGGTCIIIAPTVWQLHNYPLDCWRINPNFYEEYCKRKNFNLLDEYFDYVGISKVRKHRDASGNYVLPKPSSNRFRTLVSRTVHKCFNTYGRGMFFPSNISIGAVILKEE